MWGSQTAGAIDAFGDGSDDDTVMVFFNGAWRMRLTPSDGEVSEITLPDAGSAGAQTLGAIEIGSGGSEEFLAVVQTGDDVSVIGVFGVDASGCLFRYTDASGHHVVLPIRDTWALREGLICPDSIVADRAEHQMAGSFKLTATQLIESSRGVADWAPGTSQLLDDDTFSEVGLFCHNYWIRDDIPAL